MFLRLMEALFIAALLYIAVIQVLIPLLRGTKLFPMFLKEGKLQNQLTDARQKVAERSIKDEIKKERDKLS